MRREHSLIYFGHGNCDLTTEHGQALLALAEAMGGCGVHEDAVALLVVRVPVTAAILKAAKADGILGAKA